MGSLRTLNDCDRHGSEYVRRFLFLKASRMSVRRLRQLRRKPTYFFIFQGLYFPLERAEGCF
jgi:hypothetical protein